MEVGGPRLAIAGLGIKRGTPFYNATRSWQARWPDHAAAPRQKLALGDDELADWRDAIARIVTGLDPANGIYEQFAGFHALEPLDLAAYAERTVPIDVVIGREQTQRSQVVKPGRRGGANGAAARGIPRRYGGKEFPPLRAALRPRQFAQHGDARPWSRHVWAMPRWRCAICARPQPPTSTSTPTAPAACASIWALFLAFFRGFLFAKAIVVKTIIAAQSALRSAMTRTESFADDVPDADFAFIDRPPDRLPVRQQPYFPSSSIRQDGLLMHGPSTP